MSFRTTFLAVLLGGSLLLAALLVNRARPESDLAHPSADHIRATGKCAECHRANTIAVVHEYEGSAHASAGITCLECHQPHEGQESYAHNGGSGNPGDGCGQAAYTACSELSGF